MLLQDIGAYSAGLLIYVRKAQYSLINKNKFKKLSLIMIMRVDMLQLTLLLV